MGLGDQQSLGPKKGKLAARVYRSEIMRYGNEVMEEVGGRSVCQNLGTAFLPVQGGRKMQQFVPGVTDRAVMIPNVRHLARDLREPAAIDHPRHLTAVACLQVEWIIAEQRVDLVVFVVFYSFLIILVVHESFYFEILLRNGDGGTC